MMWAAVIGLHLIIPFMSMLLDHRVTPKQLLNTLPALHQDLMNYPTDLTSASLPSGLIHLTLKHVHMMLTYARLSGIKNKYGNWELITKNVLGILYTQLEVIRIEPVSKRCSTFPFYMIQSPFITKKYTVLYTQQSKIQIKSSNDQGIYNTYQQISVHKVAQRSQVSSAAPNSSRFVSGRCADRWWFAVWIAWYLSWSTPRTTEAVEEKDGRRLLPGLRHCCSPQNSYSSSDHCPGWSCSHCTSAKGRLYSWSTLFPCSGGLGENLSTCSIVFVSAHPSIHGRLAPGHWLQIDIEMEL